jgi:uncharacterized glyoxalase superfamily protein PhnB
MLAQVTSVFLYVDDIQKSLEFYNEIVGAEIAQLHAEVEGGPLTLAILKLGDFALMLHPQDEHAFYAQCVDEGALLALSGEPVDQAWGWREFALKDPNGYVWSIYQDKSGGQWT